MALLQRRQEAPGYRKFAGILSLGHNPSTTANASNRLMVVYNLACGNAHIFEGWFASSDIFDQQLQDEEVCCPVCGSRTVSRKPSAPNITRRQHGSGSQHANMSAEAVHALQKKLLDYVIQNSEDVGRDFPDEARRIHNNKAQARPIRGQATHSEARELIEEGIEVAPLPMAPVPRDQLH